MRRFSITLLTVLVLVALSGCARANEPAADHTVARSPDSAADMHSGMPSRAAGGGDMIEQMRMHLQMMQAVEDSMRAGMPMHRAMLDSTLAQMSREMLDMRMPADARWTALMDSVRHDAASMHATGAAQNTEATRAHHARLMRLMDRHHQMMQHKPPPA